MIIEKERGRVFHAAALELRKQHEAELMHLENRRRGKQDEPAPEIRDRIDTLLATIAATERDSNA